MTQAPVSDTWPDDLRTAYPKIFARPCELSIGPGWLGLVTELCAALQWQTYHNGAPQLVAIQVKSKFGELCFYTDAVSEDHRLVLSTGSRAQDALTDLASALSRRTCEICGAVGTADRDRMWEATRCPAHRGQRIEDVPL